MLAPTSQVLLRNEDIFTEGNWLLCNPADALIFSKLENKNIAGFHQYFDIYQEASNQTADNKHVFSAQFQCQQKLDGAVIYMPKSKQHAKMLIANLAACIKPNGQLLLVGENKAGIKSAAKLLEPIASQVNKIDSARHCSLFCAQVAEQVAPFDIAKWQDTWTLELKGTSLPLVSLPGVFSHKELDEGTKLLLEHVEDVPKGRVLDFACGTGVIGCYLAHKNSGIELVMSDVSALAIHCAKESAKLNKIDAQVVASDGLDEITGSFSGIYTNPPFHTGIQTDYSITQRFIRDVKKHMRPGGQLTLVANRFLKYPQAMQENLSKTDVLAKTNKFSLYTGFA